MSGGVQDANGTVGEVLRVDDERVWTDPRRSQAMKIKNEDLRHLLIVRALLNRRRVSALLGTR